QIQIAQSEGAERAKEGAGDVAGAEDQAGFPQVVFGNLDRVTARERGGAEEEKASEILPVAFDRAAQDAAAIDLSSHRGSNRGGVREALLQDHLNAPGGVIERDSFDLRVPGKEIQALAQGHGMRKHTADFGK